MKYSQLILSKFDKLIIENLLSKTVPSDTTTKSCFEKLKTELQSATITNIEDVPQDIVRLGSIIDIETPFGIMDNYQLVVPKDSDSKNKMLSILSPMGSALIGYAQGDTLIWHFPIGERQIKIIAVNNNHLL